MSSLPLMKISLYANNASKKYLDKYGESFSLASYISAFEFLTIEYCRDSFQPFGLVEHLVSSVFSPDNVSMVYLYHRSLPYAFNPLDYRPGGGYTFDMAIAALEPIYFCENTYPANLVNQIYNQRLGDKPTEQDLRALLRLGNLNDLYKICN